MAEAVRLLVGTSSAGQPVFEEVLAESCGPDEYHLVRSPGLALGIAAGDIFRRASDGAFSVLKRGGNLCIQVFCRDQLDSVEREATRALGRLGGRLDGKASKELVYTISATVGFGPLEVELAKVVAIFPTAEWYYGNVYDPSDGVTPLDWWKN